jgi:hypothetical protein
MLAEKRIDQAPCFSMVEPVFMHAVFSCRLRANAARPKK